MMIKRCLCAAIAASVLGIVPRAASGDEVVLWTNAVNAAASSTALQKTVTSSAWNAGAMSTKAIAGGDGHVEFTAVETNKARMAGLSHGDSNQNNTDIDFAIQLRADGIVQIFEGAVSRGTFGAYGSADRFRVAVTANVVTYWRNGALLYTSAIAPKFPLLVDTSLFTPGATLVDSALAGALVRNVAWVSRVKATALGNNLLKSFASTAWDAGAVSGKSLASDDGYAELTVTETNRNRVFGLGVGNTGPTQTDVEFGVYLLSDGTLQVLEAGVSQGVFGTYAAGDRFRVEVVSGLVRYSRNGTVFHTSATPPSYPLRVDTSFYDNTGTVTHAVMAGTFVANQAPTASAGGPYLVTRGTALTLNGTASSDPDGALVSYQWDFGDGTTGLGPTVSKVYTVLGKRTITLTVRDEDGVAATASGVVVVAPPPENVVWTNVLGATASGNSLARASHTAAWNAGAVSTKAIQDEGFVEFTVTETNTSRIAGLGRGDTDQGLADVEYGVQLTAAGRAYVYESGTSKRDLGTYAAGNKFRVAVESGVVIYRKNGVVVHTGGAPVFPLRADASLYTAGATMTNAVIAAGTFAPNEPPVASAGGPYFGTAGQPVYFNARASSDPDGNVLSFAWDFGDGTSGSGDLPSHAYAAAGTYTVVLTVSDGAGGVSTASATATVTALPPASLRNIVWKNVVKAAADGNSLTKAPPAGDGGAVSKQTLVSGEGYVEFTATERNTSRLFGLGTGDASQAPSDIEFAVSVLADGTFEVREAGSFKASFGPYAAGDRFRVGVESGVVRYRRNGVEFYASAIAPTYPLSADTSLPTDGATITHATISGTFAPYQAPVAVIAAPEWGNLGVPMAFDGEASDPIGNIATFHWEFGDGTTAAVARPLHTFASPGTYTVRLTVNDVLGATATATTTARIATATRGVVWKKLVNATASGSTLTKTTGQAAWDAGASSRQELVSGDGYVELTAAETNLGRMVGLSRGDSNASHDDIDFSLHLWTGGQLSVWEAGTYRGGFGSYQTGDSLRVSVESGVVRYWRNGTLLYTSTVAPVYPLLADASLHSVGGTLSNAVIAGTFAYQAPVADAGGPYFGTPGAAVSFDGDASDPEGYVTSFAWEFGDGSTGTGPRPTHVYATAGLYFARLTVTDILGMTATASTTVAVTPATRNVVWKNLVNATPSGNNLTKTAGLVGTWDAGASSKQVLMTGDGYVEYTATNDAAARMLGLANGDTTASFTDIEFALYLAGSTIYIYESGVERGTFGTVAAGDIVRVAVESGVVKYRKNGTLLYTSAVSPTYPLLVDASINTMGGTLTNAVISGNFLYRAPAASAGGPYAGGVGSAVAFNGEASDPEGNVATFAWDFGDGTTGTGSRPTHTYGTAGVYAVGLTVTDVLGKTASATTTATITPLVRDIVWTNAVKVTASGNNLLKPVDTGAWDGGAVSKQTLVSGDGYVEFTATETNAYRMFGLGTGDVSQSYVDIEFAAYLLGDGTLEVWESGVQKGAFGTYASGDRFRVGVESGAVKYRKNGVVYYTSTVAPTYPLLADTSMLNVGTITNATISGNFPPYQAPIAKPGGPYAGALSASVAFNGDASDPSGVIVTFAWEFGDGTTGSGARPAHSYAAAGVYTVRLTVTDVVGATATATTTATITPLVRDIVWTNAIKVTASGNNLLKPVDTGAWDGGAVSKQTLVSGDGYVEFTATETNKYRMFGLGTGDVSQSYVDIEFATYLLGDGTLEVWESGVQKGAFGTYASGDRFRVGVESGAVKYRKNGVVYYTSTVAPTYPLLADTSMLNVGTITNATISGNFPPYQLPIAGPGGPYTGAPGAEVAFNGDASDPGGSIVTFAWNFGDGTTGSGARPAHTYAAAGVYTVRLTVTDVLGATATATTMATITPAVRDVVWTNAVNVTVSANSLTKVGQVGWDGGAVSKQTLVSGDGYVEFTATETNKYRMFGLGTGDVSQSYVDIEFAAYLLGDGTLEVWESGVKKGAFGTYASGDRFRVGVESGVVKYRKNGVVFYTSASAPAYPLRADTSMLSNGGTVTSATISGTFAPYQAPVAVPGGPYAGSPGSPLAFNGEASDPHGNIASYVWEFGDETTGSGARPAHVYAAVGVYTVRLTVTDIAGQTAEATTTVAIAPAVRDVVWTNAVKVTVSGSNLTKFGTGPDGWDGGAVSKQTLVSGDGYVEITATETNKYRMFGLGTGDTSQHYIDIEFAAFLLGDGTLEVWEAGVKKGAFGTYASGDRLRVGVESSAVKYRKNGVVFYTSAAAPAYPLRADTSMLHDGGTITSATISGTFAPYEAPLANTGGPYWVGRGLPVLFNGEASDPVGNITAYNWDFGDGATGTGARPTHTYASEGTYTVSLTVTDVIGDTATKTTTATVLPAGRAVVWKGLVNAAAPGSTLTKTAGQAAWDAGASSKQELVSGDGYVELTVAETNLGRMIGLSRGDSSASHDDIDFALHLWTDGQLSVWEGGTYRGGFGSYQTGDRLRVSVEWGAVRYRRNGALLYTSSVSPVYPLLADASLWSVGGTLSDAVIAGTLPYQAPVAEPGGPYLGAPGAAVSFNGEASDPEGHVTSFVWEFGDGATGTGPRPAHVYATAGVYTVRLTVTDILGVTATATTTAAVLPPTRSVVWKNLVNTTASTNSLTKTAGLAGTWDAGASSKQVLLSGDGYVEFTATTPIVPQARMLGLGHGDASASFTDIEFAIFLAGGDKIYVYESGVEKGIFGTFVAGDVLRVAVEAGVVKYRKNGALLYTSTTPPVYPLLADAAINTMGVTLANAVVSGTLAYQAPAANPGGPYAGAVGSPIAFDGDSSDPDGNIASFAWDFGDGTTGTGPRPTHAYAAAGLYTVRLTVTDILGATATATTTAAVAPAARNVVWKNLVNVTASGNTLTKTAGGPSAWDAGASSKQELVSGDGHVELTTTETNTYRMLGLSRGDSNTGFEDIDFALYPSASGQVNVYEAGIYRGAFGPYQAGDRLRVAVESGVVKYRRNGALLYTSTVAPTYPLLADASLHTAGATLTNVVMSGTFAYEAPMASPGGPYVGAPGSAIAFDGEGSDTEGNIVSYLWDFGDGTTGSGPRPTHAYGATGLYTVRLTVTDIVGATATATTTVMLASATRSVVWTNAVKVTVSGSNLTKFGTGPNGWDGGAISKQALVSGDGYVEFTATETNKYRMFGLGTGDVDQHYIDIEFAVYLLGDGTLEVWEAGFKKGAFGTYASGDRLRVAVDSGVVKYSKNGVVYYTSASAPAYPLRADTSMLHDGGTITDAAISGTFAPYQPPVANAGGPYFGPVGSPIAFNGEASDPDGNIASYSWEFGDGTTGSGARPTHVYGVIGVYAVRLTVTDIVGSTATATATVTVNPAVRDVVWINPVKVTVSGNSLTKVGDFGWDGGAASRQVLVSGDGYVEFTATETDKYRMFGLGTADTSQSYGDIEFATYLRANGTMAVWESGVYKGSFGTYASGDRFRVGVESGVVKYRKNGVIFYTSSAAPTYPLLADTSLFSDGGTITNATISGTFPPYHDPIASAGGSYRWTTGHAMTFDGTASTDPDGAIADFTWDFGDSTTGSGPEPTHVYVWPGTYTARLTVTDAEGFQSSATATVVITSAPGIDNATWINVAGVTAAAGALTKTAGDGWNAGAASAETLIAGDGYVQTTVAEAHTYRLFGLSVGDSDTTDDDVDCGLYLAGDGRLFVFERGVNRGSVGRYAAGDQLRVSVNDGVVRYLKNGRLLATSEVAPVYPLLVDTALYSNGATLQGVVIGGVNHDPDGDGLTTEAELVLGTDPQNPDTNGDGISDGLAVSLGISATSADTDGDGLSNATELARGTNTIDPDTDDDTVSDGADAFPLDPTRSTMPPGDPDDQTPPNITLLLPQGARLISSIP